MPFSNTSGVGREHLAILEGVFDELKARSAVDDDETLTGKLMLAFQAGATDRETLLSMGFLRTAKRAA